MLPAFIVLTLLNHRRCPVHSARIHCSNKCRMRNLPIHYLNCIDSFTKISHIYLTYYHLFWSTPHDEGLAPSGQGKKRKNGRNRRKVAFWLTPEANKALSELQSARPGASITDVLNQVLLQGARARTVFRSPMQSPAKPGPAKSLEELARQMAEVAIWGKVRNDDN